MPLPALIGMALPAIISAVAGMVGSKIGNKMGQKKNQTIAQRMQNMNVNAPNTQQIPGLRGDWSGQQGGPVQAPNYEPWQTQGQQDLFNMGKQGLQQSLGNLGQFDFGPIKDKALEDFYQQFMPHMKEQFASLEGDQRSSGFLNMIGQAGRGLETNLAAMQQDYGLKQQDQQSRLRDQYLQMMNPVQTQQYQTMFRERQPGAGESFATNILPSAIQAAGTLGGAWLQGNQTNKLIQALSNKP